MSRYQARCRDQPALGTALRVLTVRGCLVADCAVRDLGVGGRSWGADVRTACFLELPRHTASSTGCLVRATALGCWLGSGQR